MIKKNEAINALSLAGIANAAREWQILEEHFSEKKLIEALSRRVKREPMSHILGKRSFWKDEFIVNQDVLDPRPDSELLVELSIGHKSMNILDLGAGSGCLGLSLLREHINAHCVLADVSENALNIARKNATNLGLSEQTSFIRSDWFSMLQGKFDLIVSNPPYIDEDERLKLAPELMFEPKNALTPLDGDGLSPYRIIANQIEPFLKDQAIAIIEHGAKQQREVAIIFENAGFQVETFADLNHLPRAVIIRR